MKKGISGDHFFRTHLANPSRRSQSHLADLSRYPQADGSGGAMEVARGREENGGFGIDEKYDKYR